MKNLLLLFLFIPFIHLAQVPYGFTYQAVATDYNGLELVEQNVSLRVSILSESPSGTEQWIETHSTPTDGFGLFTITIGDGTSTGNGVQSSFSDIDWGGSEHHLKIEMDVSGGSDYQLLGISQLMSVPYALYAESSNTDSLEVLIENLESEIDNLNQNNAQIDSTLNQFSNSTSSYSSMTEYSLNADTVIELGSNGSLLVQYSNLTDSSYYVYFNGPGDYINGIETNSNKNLVRYDLEGNVIWSIGGDLGINNIINTIPNNKIRVVENDNFTFVLDEQISNGNTLEYVDINTCSAIFKYDKSTGEYLDSYVVNSVSGCSRYNDVFYFEEHLYVLYLQNNFLNIKKVDEDFTNVEIIETGIGTQGNSSIKVEVDYVNSLMILGVRSHLLCVGSSSATQCMAEVSVYPLPLSESFTPIATISLSSNDLDPMYSVSKNSIYVIEIIDENKFVLYEYNKFSGDIITQDQYNVFVNNSIYGPIHSTGSFLTSNSTSSSIRFYLDADYSQHNYVNISTNYLNVNSNYPLQVDIVEGSLEPVDGGVIKGEIVSRCSYENTIYSIVKTDDDSYGSRYLNPAVINNQLYGGSNLILIKDTF